MIRTLPGVLGCKKAPPKACDASTASLVRPRVGFPLRSVMAATATATTQVVTLRRTSCKPLTICSVSDAASSARDRPARNMLASRWIYSSRLKQRHANGAASGRRQYANLRCRGLPTSANGCGHHAWTSSSRRARFSLSVPAWGGIAGIRRPCSVYLMAFCDSCYASWLLQSLLAVGLRPLAWC